MRIWHTFFLLFYFVGVQAFSQPIPIQVAPATADTVSKLEILKAGRYNFEKKDSVTTFLSLAVQVELKQDKTLFYADSAVLNQRTNIVEAFGRVHINDSDSLHTYAKYMRYNANDKKSYLKGDVRLTDNKGGTLTTQELNYDLNTKIAEYKTGGKVVNKKTILTSKEGEYYEITRDVIFRKNVILDGPDYKIFTDSLLYNTQTEIARFIAPTTILNGQRKIYANDGYYDLKTGKAIFSKRSSIVDSTYSIVADSMAFDDKAGLGQFKGNVVYIDTANGISVLSNQLYANRKNASFLATEKPLMILKQDKDSLFITADTLFSGKITDMDTSQKVVFLQDTAGKKWREPDLNGRDSGMNRMFQAWSHVRIFSDSLQAVCDSLFYSATDSIFRLYRNPIVWANQSQITADTMYLFTRNQKPDRLNAFFNGFVINKTGKAQYNQVRGNTILALFKEGEIDYVRAKGRAETVYYMLDDYEKFVGMNRATSDAVDLFFEDRKPVKVKFINDLKGVTYPIKQIPADENMLKGFSWLDNLRPKNRFELLEN